MSRNNPRLFIGGFPEGIVYADRWHETNGDYQRLAFLSYATLELQIAPGVDETLRQMIETHAAELQAKRGQQYQTTTSGQTITLGYGLPDRNHPAKGE